MPTINFSPKFIQIMAKYYSFFRVCLAGFGTPLQMDNSGIHLILGIMNKYVQHFAQYSMRYAFSHRQYGVKTKC